MHAGRVLIVEDEPTLGEALRLYLTSKKYEVRLACDGSSALEELGKSRYDLLLTDLVMPGVSGEELIDHIERMVQDGRPEVIIMTAHGNLDSAVKGIKIGISAYLRKPFSMAELETGVRTAVEKRRMREELKLHCTELERKVEERTCEFDMINSMLERKVNQFFILNSMSSRARVSNSIEEAGALLVSSVAEAMGFDRVCLWFLDKNGESLLPGACHDVETRNKNAVIPLKDLYFSVSKLKEGVAFKAEGGIAVAPLVNRDPAGSEVRCWEHFKCDYTDCPARMKEALACWTIKDSCRKRSRTASNLLAKMEVCEKCHVYQINTKGRTMGMLCADNAKSGRPVTEDDLKTLNVFANTAATLFQSIRRMEQLKKNKRFTDSIISSMSSGLMVTDGMSRVRMINNMGTEIFRQTREGLLDADFCETFPEAKEMLMFADHNLSREVVIKTADGLVPVGFSNSPLMGHGGGEPEGVIVVFRDISERKKLQERLREKDRFSAIGKVASGVAHEIRNPLFGITTVAQIIYRETAPDDPHRQLIDAMLSETRRLNNLVEELLLYGRKAKISPLPVDIRGLIESVLDLHVHAIEEKGLTVEKEFVTGLSDVMLDPGQIRQVLLNLLVNALDATPGAGQIKFEARKDGGEVVIRISDNGVGISEEDLPKVFDLFYTTKEKGTGLGLAICRKIVEDHGGTLAIYSKPGKGTTAELRLPFLVV